MLVQIRLQSLNLLRRLRRARGRVGDGPKVAELVKVWSGDEDVFNLRDRQSALSSKRQTGTTDFEIAMNHDGPLGVHVRYSLAGVAEDLEDLRLGKSVL